jgi:NAD(P)-dependent dehydrogenase (short-subunit alcohol dehydrogenase family)
MKKLTGKIALVTGASRGIGAATARVFAREGAHVILVARTVGGLEEQDDAIRKAGGSATLVPLDLRDHTLIDGLGATLHERFGRLDILVGNAAMLGQLGPTVHTDPKIWQQVMDVNLTANFRLIRSMDPLLRTSDAGRAIFVTSGAATAHLAYWGAYGASKAGLESLVMTYAKEVAQTKIRVNLFDPGVVRTAMRALAFPGEDASRLKEPEAAAERILLLAEAGCQSNGAVLAA